MNNLIAKTELDNRMLKIFSPVVEDMGFEIVRVRLVDGRSKLIQVMVDNSSGTINVDECAKIMTPDPNWMACALQGGILPPLEAYSKLKEDEKRKEKKT